MAEKYSVKIPYRGRPRLYEADYYGGLDDLRRIAIRYLERLEPEHRRRIPFYYEGKKSAELYWKDTQVGPVYVYEDERFLYILYKNGSIRRMLWK